MHALCSRVRMRKMHVLHVACFPRMRKMCMKKNACTIYMCYMSHTEVAYSQAYGIGHLLTLLCKISRPLYVVFAALILGLSRTWNRSW